MPEFRAYKTYCAVTAHFTSDYDFMKQEGKCSANVKSYINRKDKHFFRAIAKKYRTNEFCAFFVSNFAERPKWVGDLMLDNNSHDVYMDWISKMQNLTYHVITEMHQLNRFLQSKGLHKEDLFKYNGEKLPIIFRLVSQNIVSKETYIAMNNILHFVDYFDRVCANDIIYEQRSAVLKNYGAFLSFHEEDIKKELLAIF